MSQMFTYTDKKDLMRQVMNIIRDDYVELAEKHAKNRHRHLGEYSAEEVGYVAGASLIFFLYEANNGAVPAWTFSVMGGRSPFSGKDYKHYVHAELLDPDLETPYFNPDEKAIFQGHGIFYDAYTSYGRYGVYLGKDNGEHIFSAIAIGEYDELEFGPPQGFDRWSRLPTR